jgi:hypothetical protein
VTVIRCFLVTSALAGCFAPSPQAGVPCAANGECPDGLVCAPATNTCERTVTDADAMVGDAGIDSPSDAMPIDTPATPQIVAHYFFDDDLMDAENQHHAAAVGANLGFLDGRNDDDHALQIPTSLTSHARIQDSPAFDIPKGTIEVWFRYDDTAAAGDLGIISRDASGTNTNGHFHLRVGHDRRVVLRIQRMSSPTVEAYRCTTGTIAVSSWHHVVISIGGSLTMEVDGVAATGTTWTDSEGTVRNCTAAWTGGIDGNDNPLIIGALSLLSTEGTGAPVDAVAGGVQIDELLIRSVP